jgi:dipeptidyl aminopeptidase/acylaminoacyl peptidase
VRRRRRVVRPAAHAAAAGLLLLLGAAALRAAPAAGDTHGTHSAHPDWTADDLLHTEAAESWTVSRDGRLAAWVKSTVATESGKETRVSNLWLSHLDAPAGAEPAPLQLTRGTDRVSSPAFSPDGEHLAFLSNRALPGKGSGDDSDESGGSGAKRQVWLLPLAGGEPYPVTRLDRDVQAFGWIDDSTLVVAAPEAKSAYELERKAQHDDAVVVDDAEHTPPVRLYRVGIDGGGVRHLTWNPDWIDALSVSPDGRWAVVSAQQSLSYEFDSKVPPQTRLVDLATGAERRLFAEPIDGWTVLPFAVRWDPDSSGFYFADLFTHDPMYRNATITRLYHLDLASGRAVRVDLGWDRGLGGGYAVLPDGFVALLADGVHDRLARYRRTGSGETAAWNREEIAWPAGTETPDPAGHVDDVVSAPDGSVVVYEVSTTTAPPQWYAAHLTGSGAGVGAEPGSSDGARIAGARRLTHLNPAFDDKPTGRAEVIHWTGARGDTVEGILQYPLGWKKGTRAPLILATHGGPAARSRDAWSQSWATPILLWRQRGAFVLQVNYHGSTGYGLEWVESIKDHYYELEIPDLETGVDHLISEGLVDPDRLAAAGWSNGGILTADLITKDQRFKAASVGAADVEWLSDWANVAFGASFDNYYFGGTPWEATQSYLDKSPFFRLTKVTTPTILYTGTEDTNVPPHESWSTFRALQQIGRAPVRLVVFPGEPHGLRKIPFQRRKIEEDLAWFDRYLFDRAPSGLEGIEAVHDSTLLAALLERAGAASSHGVLGETKDGKPIPETASLADLEVGRFEVTRAQWAAFEPEAASAPGEANLPATGMSFEQAEAYAAWLAERTGRPFRLPTTAEAKKLAAAAGSKGNTLDRWAGYTPNPDDAEAIREVLSDRADGLGGRAPLLLPVGSLPGTGVPPVFDLDGNAAEWAVDEGGDGVAEGPSADRSTDARGDGGTPSIEYTGLRVVVGEGG